MVNDLQPPSSKPMSKRIRILHVDDEPTDLEITRIFLRRGENDDFEIVSVLSAKEALKRLREEHFDVIVCDYKMPMMNGLELLEELRWNGSTVPFILFTGKGGEEVAKEAFNKGADNYITKDGGPITQCNKLARAIRGLVKAEKTEEVQQNK
jgi:CheY-like chemotaxis protein